MPAVPPDLAVILATAFINAAVTWGVVRTELRWLRRDIDDARERLAQIERHTFFQPKEQP